MKQLLYFTSLLLASFGFSQDLFFSEYAEGSSNNKYLEIYNPTSSQIDLSGYAYPSVGNAPDVAGQYEFWNEFDSGAVIPAGGVYVIAHPSADQSILDKADETHLYLSNGDDGYALAKGTESSFTIIDFIGDFEGDPGSGWDVAGVTNATKDHTLVRKSTVTSGNTDWDASRGTTIDNSEWIVRDNEDWSGLGQHSTVTPNVTYISADTTWDGNHTMTGKVVVRDGFTLTIEPGTVVKAAFSANPIDATALIVAKGGKLNAVGTADQPIIFTTEYDDLTATDVDNGKLVSTVNGATNDLTTRGLWGGIIMLGKGIVGEDGGEDDIEGVAEGYDFTTYGGSVADDNSGTLDYVSIRHGGATIANGDEINGLTLGGVGSGTSISNIEIISNDDDGIEFFGGNVDVTNILIFNQKDDAIDIDEAYAGTVTNAYVAMGADSDNVFEIDGSEDGSNTPVTGSYTIDGVTAYQAYDNSGKKDQYGHWKSGATGANNNIVFKGFAAGTYLEGVEKATFDAGTLTFSNLDFVTTDDLATVNSTNKRSASDEKAELTDTHAEILAAQAFNTGANEGKFAGWTAYGSVNPFTVNVGDGNLTYICRYNLGW